MSSQTLLVLPACSAVVYVLAALLLKRAITAGCRQPHVNLVVNLVPALLFQLFWLHGAGADWAHAWKPAVCSGFFFLGQVLTFLALRSGEVSVTTPVLGTKVVFTAVFAAVLLGQAIPAQWWLGALACSLGVMLVTGATLRSLLPRLARRDALFSLGAASTFALTDVLVQHWTRDLGVPAFVAIMFGLSGLLSLVVFAPGVLRPIPHAAVVPLLAGAVLLTAQMLSLAIALGLHESATAVNIVYGSRAVWSVGLAWALAGWMKAGEERDSRAVLSRRLAGAFLIFGAVLAVLI